jgi:hypothetical protein
MVFIDIKSKLVLCMPERQLEDGVIAPLIVSRVWTFWRKKKLFVFFQGKQVVLVAVKHNGIIIKVLFISNIDV